MTQPALAPVSSGAAGSQPVNGIGASPQPAKALGAFDAPAATKAAEPASGATAGTAAPAPVKPVTTGLSLDTGTGTVNPTKKPVEIPKVTWTPPKTVVQSTNKTPGEKAVITYVGDGDGFIFNRNDGSKVECRLDSVDAPEVAHPNYGKAGQAYGEESKRTLQDMILNKEVTVRVSVPAPGKNYGRNVCQVEIEGADVSKQMLQNGAAWVLKSLRNNPELMSLEKQARDNKAGLWANPIPQNPADFRRMQNYGR